jgi:hypothetical protein
MQLPCCLRRRQSRDCAIVMTQYRGRRCSEGGFPLTRHCWRDGGLKGTRPTIAIMVRMAETLYWAGRSSRDAGGFEWI